MNALVLGCTALHLALLGRSQSKVARLLSSNPEAMSERNAIGQTALHLAADWYWATALLLENGADPAAKDKMGVIPLGYAYAFITLDTAELLIKYGSPLSYEDHDLGECCNVFVEIPVKPYKDDRETSHKMIKLFAMEVAKRRRELLTHARENLPTSVFDKVAIGLNVTDRLPDLEAYDIIEALSEDRDDVNKHYWCFTHGSVYGMEYISVNLAEDFFNLGFCNLESMDFEGRTPLTQICRNSRSENFCGLILWLYSKRVSFTRLIETAQLARHDIPSVNAVAIRFGLRYKAYLRSGGDSKSAVRLVLGSRFEHFHDLCICPCSLHGCTPSTMFLKGLWQYRLRRTLRGIDYYLRILCADQSTLKRSSFGHAAVRMSLFKALHMRHTCCIPNRWKDPPIEPPICDDDAAEIREEDESLYETFNELLPIAQDAWSNTSLPFSEFWTKFYRDNVRPRRMANVGEDYMQQVQDLGVHVQDFSDESSCESDYSSDDTNGESSIEEDLDWEYSDDACSDGDGIEGFPSLPTTPTREILPGLIQVRRWSI